AGWTGSVTMIACGMTSGSLAPCLAISNRKRLPCIYSSSPGRLGTDLHAQTRLPPETPRSARTGGPISAEVQINAQGQAPGFTTHSCDVDVDPETGYVKILRYTAIQDVGRAIHPSYVEGQMQGGVAQGIGWALNEEYVYDQDGRLENPGFLDYRVPVCSDLP